MLESFALDLHRRQHQAVADKVGRVADTFGRFETAPHQTRKRALVAFNGPGLGNSDSPV